MVEEILVAASAIENRNFWAPFSRIGVGPRKVDVGRERLRLAASGAEAAALSGGESLGRAGERSRNCGSYD